MWHHQHSDHDQKDEIDRMGKSIKQKLLEIVQVNVQFFFMKSENEAVMANKH